MEQGLMRKKVYIIFLFLSTAILACFIVLFISVFGDLKSTNEKYVEQIADSAISKMEDVFLNLEHLSVSFSNNQRIKSMILEDDIVKYHEKASEVKADLNSIYQPDGLVDNILIYDMNYDYYRLRGKLGNTSCDRIGFSLENNTEDYFLLELKDENYLAYITKIYDGKTQIGYLVFLIKTKAIEILFDTYDSMQSIQIAIASGDFILVTNTEELGSKTVNEIETSSTTYINHQIGYTPFQVLVTDKAMFMRTLQVNFIVLILIIILVLLGFILFFYKFLNKTFFRPMISVIENVENIIKNNKKHKIEFTGEKEFDVLVGEINSMIDTLDDNANTMLKMQYEQQTSEIEKQKMEIDFLKKQINVHFTVNTINVIRRLSELGDNEKVGKMCNSLSNLLRYANVASDYVEGVEELHIIEEYLDIMNSRQSNAFTWEMDIDDALCDVLLPRMLLQPIVENALTHGIESVSIGKIFISAKISQNQLTITVSDNGIGMEKDELNSLNEKIKNSNKIKITDKGLEHIALINIQKRIRFFCGEAYGLEIKSAKDKGTTVTLTLPIIESENFTS